MIAVGAAALAWLGTSLVVASDGRRGLAAGTAIVTLGMAILALESSGIVAAAAIAIGGGVAAARRLASGAVGWDILPPGSTPRLVLCIAAAILAFWVAAGVASGPGAPLRFSVMLVIGLAGARVLASIDTPVLLTAAALLALAVGLGAGLAQDPTTPWPYVAGGLVAAVVVWLPPRSVRAA